MAKIGVSDIIIFIFGQVVAVDYERMSLSVDRIEFIPFLIIETFVGEILFGAISAHITRDALCYTATSKIN